MGQKHQTGDGDDERIGHHQAARPGPDRTYRESQSKSRNRMRRREACIRFGSGEVSEIVGIGLASDERAAATDVPFEKLARQQRYRHREKEKLQAQAEAKESGL